MSGGTANSKNRIHASTRSGFSISPRTLGVNFLLAITALLFCLPATDASATCSFNGNGNCSVSTNLKETYGFPSNNNQSVVWKIRPQNIGFMYYLRTSEDGNDLSVRGIVKWKVQTKNWTPNDTVPEGFLVTIVEHDTNETVISYELSLSEFFEKFAETNEVLETRMELDDVLKFEKRYDAKISILPIGKQAAASSFLSIMGKLEGEKCSAMTGLAERWAPHVMVDVYQTTSEIELTWQPAPSFLCIQSYEVVLQNRDGVILNTSEIEVSPGQLMANASFGNFEKNQMFQVKVRGKNSVEGGCACINCNCITDKTKYFLIPEYTRPENNATAAPAQVQYSTGMQTWMKLGIIFGSIVAFSLFCLGCCCCWKDYKTVLKKKIAFSELKTSTIPYPNRKSRTKKCFKVLLVCPEIEGKDYEYMMKIAEAFKNSNNKVVCNRWNDEGKAEENMLRWVYEQTQRAEKIILFHSTHYQASCGVYDMITNFFPCNDPKLAHIALTTGAQRAIPCEVEYVLPRDQNLVEDAYGINIEAPLVIDIPRGIEILEPTFPEVSCSSIEEDSLNNTKNHSTDSGVSSMSSNSSDSDGMTDTMQSQLNIRLKELNIEAHPLLRQAIPV